MKDDERDFGLFVLKCMDVNLWVCMGKLGALNLYAHGLHFGSDAPTGTVIAYHPRARSWPPTLTA
jgi:hypothetical protein